MSIKKIEFLNWQHIESQLPKESFQYFNFIKGSIWIKRLKKIPYASYINRMSKKVESSTGIKPISKIDQMDIDSKNICSISAKKHNLVCFSSEHTVSFKLTNDHYSLQSHKGLYPKHIVINCLEKTKVKISSTQPSLTVFQVKNHNQDYFIWKASPYAIKCFVGILGDDLTNNWFVSDHSPKQKVFLRCEKYKERMIFDTSNIDRPKISVNKQSHQIHIKVEFNTNVSILKEFFNPKIFIHTVKDDKNQPCFCIKDHNYTKRSFTSPLDFQERSDYYCISLNRDEVLKTGKATITLTKNSKTNKALPYIRMVVSTGLSAPGIYTSQYEDRAGFLGY